MTMAAQALVNNMYIEALILREQVFKICDGRDVEITAPYGQLENS